MSVKVIVMMCQINNLFGSFFLDVTTNENQTHEKKVNSV